MLRRSPEHERASQELAAAMEKFFSDGGEMAALDHAGRVVGSLSGPQVVIVPSVDASAISTGLDAELRRLVERVRSPARCAEPPAVASEVPAAPARPVDRDALAELRSIRAAVVRIAARIDRIERGLSA